MADVHGFVIFAPYMAVAMAVTHLISRRRRRYRAVAADDALPALLTPATP
jgi:hypothetical protein